MEASILDLRYRMKSVLAALDRGEPVTVLHRGKQKAKLVPIRSKRRARPITDHPAFGMWANREDLADPGAFVRGLRARRFHDL